MAFKVSGTQITLATIGLVMVASWTKDPAIVTVLGFGLGVVVVSTQ